MLVTVTNASSTLTLNQLAKRELIYTYFGINVTGGQISNPLPHPFDLVEELAPAGTVQRSVHESDYRKQQWFDTHDPAQEWNHLVQAGIVTLAVAAEADSQDVEDDFISNI